MRSFLILFFSYIAFGSGYCFYACAPITNPAVEIGYYGYYHRVQRVIKSIPNVTIVETWQHADISLENFGFTLQRPNAKTVGVMFRQSSYEMDFSDDKQIRNYVLAHLNSVNIVERSCPNLDRPRQPASAPLAAH
jgi:hypothetical protein